MDEIAPQGGGDRDETGIGSEKEYDKTDIGIDEADDDREQFLSAKFQEEVVYKEEHDDRKDGECDVQNGGDRLFGIERSDRRKTVEGACHRRHFLAEVL